ncbi:hypothetical protein DCO44_15855 [Acinetobacter sp. AM]|uniref:hypothetical protein n=1 Tax=Acinetobacter sp. AM TaxID=2170730 RepID=UPI000DE61F04|nr:hypothetical protein [Acinetobacter sp. AM]PWB13071.1 hypothetical protein DCO44_15855 [Acinetobacter sp. AM]
MHSDTLLVLILILAFPEFLQAIWSAGIIRYVVNFVTRYVIYYGCSGESYSEEYPAVTLPI